VSYEVVMPAMEMDQVSATLLQWLKPVGALVAEGEPLMEIETDKVTVEIEAPVSGILESVRAAPGDVVPVGTLVAVIGVPREDGAPVPGSHPAPSVAAAMAGDPSAEEPATSRTIRLSAMQSRVAARVQQSYAQAPHIFFRRTVDVTALISDDQARPPGSGRRPTLLAHVLSACAATLVEFPTLNAHLVNDELILWPDVHLGVAVAAGDQLIVPVIRHSQLKSVIELTAEVADLATRARASELSPAEVRGSTFSVSNLGRYDIDDFTAIINPPEIGILAIGRAELRPAVAADGNLIAAQLCTLTLGVDHRAVNGAMAASFLTALSRRLERSEPGSPDPTRGQGTGYG
jgi:pyruvate dehydrogenase E2 component (dihydrolipoamide acetyltransferase)